MALHKFHVGQEVSFLPSALDFNVPRGPYRIVRQLPLESAGYSYRVMNIADGHERIVREDQLAAGAAEWRPPPASSSARVKAKPRR